jgi:KDO2-lipid IV(A) lauroyltransferase
MSRSFPEKSQAEIMQEAKAFYKHFCDLVVESVKGFSMSKAALSKRMVFTNTDLFKPYFERGQDIIVVGGHYNNWEWCGFATPLNFLHQSIGLYAPLTNKFFDKKMKASREKFGLILCPMNKTRAYMEKDLGKAKATFFIIDQTPSNVRRCHWMEFLNQDTPVFYGAERYAKLYDLPVFFMKIDKVKRGHYSVTAELLFEKPKETEQYEITELSNRKIEQQIINDSRFWLWTHRRWKRKRPNLENS